MVDPVTTQALSSATAGTAQSPLSTGPGQAAAPDAAAFQQAVQRPEATAPAPDSGGSVNAGPRSHAAQSPVHEPASSPLPGIDQLSADMRAMKADVETSMANVKGDMGELIGLQFKTMQITTAMTVMGQGGQKTGQGIQQLLKGQ
jgi:hypothetical protein